MANTIPAYTVVQVNPGVISAGGNDLALSGLCLTNSTRAPIGQILSFPNALSVGSYFGLTSTEYNDSLVYFQGTNNSYVKPGALLFAQYPTNSVAAYLRGGSLASLGLTGLQAITTGTFTVTIDGVAHTSNTVNLSTATSFSNAATLLTTALNSSPAVVTYDTVGGGFIITSGTTGSTSAITFATGTLSATLCFTQATGAVLSQGALGATPAAFMATVISATTNWASFWTNFNPDNTGFANRQAFANWTSTQNDLFAYICTDNDITATTTVPATASLGYALGQSAANGTILVWEPSTGGPYRGAAFVAGYIASIDFNATQGNTNLKFSAQGGLTPAVTDATAAANLESNGYNYMGIWANGNNQWTFMSPGSITGIFKWANDYVNQIWLNTSFQTSLMTLLTNVKSIPYNRQGYSLIEAACMDVINRGLNFGMIQPGVTLSNLQATEIDTASGVPGSWQAVQTQGWYLRVADAAPATRAARQSPPCTFWYASGGSVNKITLASLEVQ